MKRGLRTALCSGYYDLKYETGNRLLSLIFVYVWSFRQTAGQGLMSGDGSFLRHLIRYFDATYSGLLNAMLGGPCTVTIWEENAVRRLRTDDALAYH
jgi:hypothetical protein